MYLLRIRHAVPDFDGWRRAFESDPLDRQASGVRRYDLYRSVADPNMVVIDLAFDQRAEAERMLERLRRLWRGPGADVMQNPEAWILEVVESRSL